MLRKTILGIAAAASLSAVALTPTTASAWHPHHIGHHHGHWGHGFGFRVGFIGGGYDGCYVTRRVFTPYGVVFRTVNVCY